MNYLLLGGAGFIGTHLAKELIAEGHRVTIIDSCVTSSPPKYKVEFYHNNITTFEGLEACIQAADVVYFLAGSVGVKHVVEHPYHTLCNNIGLAETVIPLLQKHQKPVLFTSTSEVYGDGPFVEDGSLSIGSPTNLRWSYASAKLTTEFMIISALSSYKILRLFNVVGPGQLGEYGMVIPRFVAAAKQNQDIVIYGDGSQKRSFCHVKDAIRMIRELENAKNGIYNIGCETPITVNQLADIVIDVTKSNSSKTYKTIEQAFGKHGGDINNRVPNLTKLKQTISYKTNYNIIDIIKEVSYD